jgi:hypothetical protein
MKDDQGRDLSVMLAALASPSARLQIATGEVILADFSCR